ncbi:sensor histidine kinase [Actinomadura macrotermitis]|uniref:Signal transduction histidine kinase subgroup 3 dimerisation and phosphoacceptor domain-containing protein n=1 Tax=Actinomadura macrotermitis TaxID=2585200 RepID=A0A7K0BZE0_9ACTN|nr:hypothetical protein [Actinomadura macrotermitis]
MRDEASERGTGLAGFHRYTWWAVQGTTVGVLLLFTGGPVLDGGAPPWTRALTAVALAAEVAAAVALLHGRLSAGPRSRPPTGWTAAAITAAAVLAAIPLAEHDHGRWAIAPAMTVAIIATYLPPRPRRRLIFGAAALAMLPGAVTGGGDLAYAVLFPAGTVLFAAWMTLGPLWAWDVAGRLDEARRLSAELAVKDERLRFAADLHDIQGHHLQVIALKSELAARLAAADPARAAAEMEEVRRLAADALRDTRAVVQGYRRTALDEEIANATRVLAAAGIDARTDLAPAALAGPARHLLGLVMREATTNVLRHSRARHATVDYRVADGVARLRVGNDGAHGSSADASGTGLRTLADRLHGAGGALTWTRDGDRFEVTATLPAGPEAR